MMSHQVSNVSSLAQQQMMNNRIRIGISNWQNGSLQDLLNFLSRNSRISLMSAAVEGPLVVGFVQNMQQAEQLRKWNGAKFAGNNLKIEIMTNNNTSMPSSASTSSTVVFLRNILNKRYDPQTKMLNLGELINDPELMNNGMFSSAARQSKILPAMLKVASTESNLLVESINLANNNLKDIIPISNLPLIFKDLKNLCLANNNITRFQPLMPWKNKFIKLRELLMVNNPVTNDKMYRSEMLNIFPKLVLLDNVIVRDENKLSSLFKINPLQSQFQQFFFENQTASQFATDFITNFLNLWDSDKNNIMNTYNRSQLLNLYTPQSQFSIAIDSSIPASAVREADQNPSFGYYLSTSRNFTKVSTPKLLQERLATGQENINKIFNSIPRTKHSLLDNPNDYSVEAYSYPQVNGFIVTLHGVYEEIEKPIDQEINDNKNSNTYKKKPSKASRYSSHANNKRLSKKSFDRTWVIINNPATNSIIIASDLLSIRAYVSPSWKIEEQPKPQVSTTVVPQQQQSTQLPTGPTGTNIIPQATVGGMAATAQTVSPHLQLPPDIQAKLTPIQLELLHKLQLQTKLNSEYTYMLAEQSGWNYEAAINGFQNSAANLPPNAFIQ